MKGKLGLCEFIGRKKSAVLIKEAHAHVHLVRNMTRMKCIQSCLLDLLWTRC